MGRRIFVGDVQGCREELEELLERVGFEQGRDELHPVGDFVNRGPDSAGVLRLCRALDAGGVLGNHDVHLLRVRAGTRAPKPGDTLDELLAGPEADELCAWLARRPFLRAFDDVLAVHAGLSPAWREPREALAGQDPLAPDAAGEFAIAARYCTARGERPPRDWPAPDPPFAPWWSFLPERDAPVVVFGHWARQGLVLRPGLRGLDSGCVWGGALSAWIAEEDRIVQVAAHRVWSRAR